MSSFSHVQYSGFVRQQINYLLRDFHQNKFATKKALRYRRATIVADGKRAGGDQHPPAGLDGGQQEGQGLLHLRVLGLKN